MPRKITVIDGHPDPDRARLCHALATAYENGARESGHEVERITVADLDFPILRTQAAFEGVTLDPVVAEAQRRVAWADHLVIIYPLWLGTMPALLKALFEQVFRPGFAFEAESKGWPKKLLAGRTARIVITMGMPAFYYRWVYLAHSLRSLERNILRFSGIKPVGETIFGLVQAASDEKRKSWLDKVSALGRRGA